MSFVEAVRTCFRRLLDFHGRSARPEFWWFILFVLLGQVVAGFLDGILFGTGEGAPAILTLLFGLATVLPSLSVSIRRLHDIGRTGWWIFVNLIPVLGALLLIWWYTRPGDAGPNVHGPPPPGGRAAAEGTPAA